MDTSKPMTPQRILDASEAELLTLNPRHALALYREYRLLPNDSYDRDVLDTPYDLAAERLKEILAKMPHIPTKREGTLLRRLAAKRGK